MLRITWFYLRLISNADRDSNDPLALAGWCLIQKKSFRNPGKLSFSSFRIFVAWAKAVKRLFSLSKNGREIAGGNSKFALWDNRADVQDIRLGHIKANGGELPSLFVARNETGAGNIFQAIGISFLFTLLLPFLFTRALFSRNKANIALLFNEWMEAYGLLQAMKRYKIQHLYFFCPYENDANAIYLLLQTQGISVNKIPSPNLLAIHNTEMLTDILTLTSPCQVDELTAFAGTMKYKEIVKWLPEQFHSYSDFYKVRNRSEKFSIGFYSHGSWIRRLKGNTDNALGEIEAEIELVKVLAGFLAKHKDFSLTIFLHPNEKRYADFNAVTSYYDEAFGVKRYAFAAPSEPSATKFDTVDIGLGALSTILFERLFMGCKTIFYPLGVKIFPAAGTSIAAICPVTPSALEILILHLAGISTAAYLEEYDLEKYTVYNWNPGLNYEQKN